MNETVMSVFSQVAAFMSQPLGNLAHHSVLLLLAVAALGMAWGDWQRTRQAPRLVVVTGGLVLFRAVYLLAAVSVRIGWLAPDVLLPPLERFVDLASVGLVAWAFMPLPPGERTLTWDRVFGLGLALAMSCCVWFVTLWNQALGDNPLLDYNTYWQAQVWIAAQAAVLVLGILAVLSDSEHRFSQGRGRGAILAAMAILLVGQGLQLLFPEAAGVPHLPLWGRLADLVAFPLIAVAVYQRIVSGLGVHGSELESISLASLDQVKSLLHLFEATQQMGGAIELSKALDHAVHGLGRALEADQCAIAFPLEGDPNQFRLAAVYSPLRQGRGERGVFALENQLAIRQAVRRKQHVILEGADSAQQRALFALLGSNQAGPLLVQPLVADPNGESLGVIIVGNAQSRRPFAPNDAKLCQTMAAQVVAAIQNTQRYRLAQDKLAEMTAAQNEAVRTSQLSRAKNKDLNDRLAIVQAEMETLRQTREALEHQLVNSRMETDTLTRQLATLELDLTSQHEPVSVGLQGVEVGVLLADVEGSVRATNSVAEDLLQRDWKELLGLKLEAVTEDVAWKPAAASAMGGDIARLVLQIEGNAILCDMIPLTGAGNGLGEFKGLAVVLRPYSGEAQSASLAAGGELVQGLRVPMDTIIGYTDLLLSEATGALADTQRKYLSRIRSGAEQAARRIQQLSRAVESESDPAIGRQVTEEQQGTVVTKESADKE